jgi:hypothetical protein
VSQQLVVAVQPVQEIPQCMVVEVVVEHLGILHFHNLLFVLLGQEGLAAAMVDRLVGPLQR